MMNFVHSTDISFALHCNHKAAPQHAGPSGACSKIYIAQILFKLIFRTHQNNKALVIINKLKGNIMIIYMEKFFFNY